MKHTAVRWIKTACLICVIFSLCLLLTGCGAQERRAEAILAKVLTCTRTQKDDFSRAASLSVSSNVTGMSRTDRLSEYLTAEYAACLTDDCIRKMACSRAFLAGAALFTETCANIFPENIELSRGCPQEASYSYTADLWAGGKRVAIATGILVFSGEDTQKASLLTVDLTAV